MKENRLHGLDHLRAIAILLVWMYHYRAFTHPDWVDTLGGFGWTGVDLFFVLSGFLISGQLFRELRLHGTLLLKPFLIKRFFRIIPPYAFTLLLYFCFPIFREREALPPLWKFVTFTQNYALDVVNAGTFSHAWSLCIEEQFYLVLPLALLALVRFKLLSKIRYFLIFSIILSILLRLYAWNHFVHPLQGTDGSWRIWYMYIYYPTPTRLDALAIGVLFGFMMAYSTKFQSFIHKNGLLLFFSGIGLLLPALWICYDQASQAASVIGFTLVGLAYGLLVLSAVSKSSFLSKAAWAPSRQLADLSFTIYLSHKGIIHIIQLVMKSTAVSNNQLMLICLLGCVATGLLYRYLIERPAMLVKNHLLIKLKKS